jgi:hypothetical protein
MVNKMPRQLCPRGGGGRVTPNKSNTRKFETMYAHQKQNTDSTRNKYVSCACFQCLSSTGFIPEIPVSALDIFSFHRIQLQTSLLTDKIHFQFLIESSPLQRRILSLTPNHFSTFHMQILYLY